MNRYIHRWACNNNNNGNLSSAYPVAQSAAQAYTHNVHRDGKCYPKKKKKKKRKKKRKRKEKKKYISTSVDKRDRETERHRQ